MTAAPLFVAGVAGVYPVFWFGILLGSAVVAYAVYLLYSGIPIVMNIRPARGFLFAGAVVAVGLAIAIAVMGATVVFWELISAPVFER